VLSYTRDLGHDGVSLYEFWRRQPLTGSDRVTVVEVAVLRAYTGPWFVAINFYLRYLPVADCCTSTPYHSDDALRAYDPRRLFLADPSDPSSCKLCGKTRREHDRQSVDSWATSAALLYNGIVKLATASKNAKVYRGVKEVHVRLPDSFVENDSHGFAGGVELGAMSTTTNEEVATSYMGADACSLFEIEFTMQARGADLSFLSQYPAEREMLYPPGTSLTCRSQTGVRQRRLHLAAEYIVDTKMREVVAPITSLDYVPLDALRPLLDPLSFDADIREYSSRFVNGTRGWVFREVEQWLLTKMDSRCRVLFGGPGFGKTAIVSRLCETRRDAVVGVHLCRHNDSRRRDPRRMICSLAHQLTQSLLDYRSVLEAMRGQLSDIGSLGATELVDMLLVQPLASIAPPRARKLLIIDALDEAEQLKRNELLKLIRDEFKKLPAWICVLVTSRPEVPIKRELSVLKPEELDADSHARECDEDVRIFLRSILKSESSVEKVAAKAGRVFLYLHWVRLRIKEEGEGIDVDALPDGLAGEYKTQLERLGVARRLEGDIANVLQTTLCAAEPLHVKELPLLSGVPKCRDIVEALSQLFPVREQRVHVFHKSIADWFTGSEPYEERDNESDYYVDRCEGHGRLADVCCANWSATRYCTRWALYHCSEAGRWGAFEEVATQLEYIDARFEAGSGSSLGIELGLVSAVAPFERLVLKEMPVMQREKGAIHQLAYQQPDKSRVFRVPKSGGVRWMNKPQVEDACVLTMQCSGTVRGFARMRGGKFVVGAGKKVEVRDARNGAVIEEFESSSHVMCVAATDLYFCAGFEDGTIKVWDSGAFWPKLASLSPKLTLLRFLCSDAGTQDGEGQRAQRLDLVCGLLARRIENCLGID
jgi:hypothetical protein